MQKKNTVFGKNYADAYDLLYLDKDYGKECNFLEELCRKYQSDQVGTILDLGCGTGEHALHLARRGYSVTGVDFSEEMVKLARGKFSNENVKAEFIRGDISDIELQRKFDIVISMFAVMGYQTSNSVLSDVCRVARNHLVQGGLFIFDCWNGNAVLLERPVARVKEVKLDEQEKLIRFAEPVLNTIEHTVEVKFRMLRIRKDTVVSETRESHLMRFFFPQEIKYFLEVAGFEVVEYCPFLNLGNKLTDDDWNMSIIAKAV